jgi:hypothetical protein
VLNVLLGIALIAAFLSLWIVGWYVFTWLLSGILSLTPYVGKRHKHARWNELNRINTGELPTERKDGRSTRPTYLQ